MLRPALKHLSPTGGVEIVTIGSDADTLGYLPLVRRRWLHMPAAAVASVWVYAHCYDATPVVAAGREEEFLDRLFSWLEDTGASVLRWPMLPADTRFAAALFRHAKTRGQRIAILHCHRRPLLGCTGRTPEAWLDAVMSRRGQRTLNRRRRQLAERGELRLRSLDEDRDGLSLARTFLRLEASGWKGEGGQHSALLHRKPADVAFFEEAVAAGASNGGLAGFALDLDGEAVAMTVNVRAGEAVWSLKTAYDEQYASQAPGVLLQVDEALAAISDPAVAWMDACTDVTNSLLDKLYPQRREILDLMIATSPQANHTLRAAACVERGYRKARGLAKAAYYAVKS